MGPHPYPEMVAQFQSVISEEIKKQLLEKEGRDYPDTLIACVGGGSNAAGTFLHYLNEKRTKIIAVEAGGLGIETGETAATMSCGTTGIIHGAKTLLMQDGDGQIIEPYSISAGLDYPGVGPLHSHLFKTGRMRVFVANDNDALNAAFRLTKLEGIIPALESAHALAALEKIKFEKDEVVVLTVSGRGDKDMGTYLDYFAKQN